MLVDWVANVFSLERSVFATMIKLLLDPRKIVENYWLGNRGYQPSPGKIFFYGLACAALHITYVNSELLGLTLNLVGVQAQLFFWALFFPLLTVSSLLTFIRKKQPFTKHLISLTYIGSSFFIIVTILQDAMTIALENYLTANAFFLFLICVMLWNAITFSGPRKYLEITLYTVLQILVFAALVASLLGLVYLKNPEALMF